MEPNINSSGMMNGLPQVPKENKKIGPILGALAIVLIIIIASLIFFGKKLNINSSTSIKQTTSSTPVDATSQTNTGTQTVEDSGAAINADLDLQLKDIDYSF